MTIAQTPPLWSGSWAHVSRTSGGGLFCCTEPATPGKAKGWPLIYIYFRKAAATVRPSARQKKYTKFRSVIEAINFLLRVRMLLYVSQVKWNAARRPSSVSGRMPKTCWPASHFLWQLEQPLCMPSAIYCISISLAQKSPSGATTSAYTDSAAPTDWGSMRHEGHMRWSWMLSPWVPEPLQQLPWQFVAGWQKSQLFRQGFCIFSAGWLCWQSIKIVFACPFHYRFGFECAAAC